MFLRLICLFFILLPSAFALSYDRYPFNDEAENKRFIALTQEIRCLVCKNQSVADSTAPLALDLKNKIYNMMIAKKTNADIKNYLVKRYGNFILFKPPFNFLTLILWAFPMICFILTLFFLLRRTFF